MLQQFVVPAIPEIPMGWFQNTAKRMFLRQWMMMDISVGQMNAEAQIKENAILSLADVNASLDFMATTVVNAVLAMVCIIAV